ncbi:MAG TPA: cache domain-containing protein [Noviherbaspirillum sp.]|uniref:cache domain-containing protein n=1 Tax=Noviherbaspirillum sp. TaxID=1926288 RepID=UPI002B463123|nr:cache domain-containing protein [Noviherbaspirillum sp.]HJV86558.1 cache domain-containing protein [Noviherbaspirillum sp.]
MKRVLKFFIGACLSLGFVASSHAGDKGTKDEAVALVHKAIAFYKAHGKDKAFAEVSNKSGQFVDRDMYVYILDTNGTMMAHGANEKLIGKDLTNLKDADGKLFAQELIAHAKAKKAGWVDYKWPNPVTKQIESKTTYVEAFDGYGFAVGVYK